MRCHREWKVKDLISGINSFQSNAIEEWTVLRSCGVSMPRRRISFTRATASFAEFPQYREDDGSSGEMGETKETNAAPDMNLVANREGSGKEEWERKGIGRRLLRKRRKEEGRGG